MARTSFPVPTQGTAWASGGISGKIQNKGGSKMRRRKGFSQKPWNKKTADQKFWVPSIFLDQGAVNQIQVDTGVPTYVAYYTGEQLTGIGATSGVTASAQRALQTAKLHRFQGHIWTWLDPGAQDDNFNRAATGGSISGTRALPNVSLLTYIWMKMKDDSANNPTLNSPPSVSGFDPSWATDLKNILTRKDVYSWGTIPVWGIVPRILSQIQGAASSASVPSPNSNSELVANPGMYLQNTIARIPFPRVPKTGFSLRKGEGLACIAAQIPGPGALTNNPLDEIDTRSIVCYDVSRVLCSL